MATKMTKKEMFNAIRAMVIDNQEMVEFIDREIELLNRKSSAPKKPTKTQIENEGFKADIIKALTDADTLLTITEICEACNFPDEMSNQRVTHLLTALRKEKKVRREYVKRKAYFAIGAEPDEE